MSTRRAYGLVMPRYRVSLNTTLTVTVNLEAKDEDGAADLAWKAAEGHVQTYPFSRSESEGVVVLADATFDGIGADEVEEVE
jgi:hypothetical protein